MDPENSSNLELPFHEYTYIAAGGGVPGDRGQDKGRVQTRWQSPAAPEPDRSRLAGSGPPAGGTPLFRTRCGATFEVGVVSRRRQLLKSAS